MPNHNKPLNLKDVARILGVSTATVSNAFNRPSQLSQKLREKILTESHNLGYHGPNLAARSLRRGKSDVIAVVLADSLSYNFSDPVASQFLQGVSDVLVQHSKQLLLLSSELAGREQSTIESLPDGFIFYGTPSGDCFERIHKLGKPIVAVDFDPEGLPNVKVPNESAAEEIALHALKHSHGSVAIVGLRLTKAKESTPLTPDDLEHPKQDVAYKRLLGYLRAANKMNIEIPAHHIWHTPENTPEIAEEVARQILGSTEPPDTIICMSDVLALGVLRVAKSMSLDIPEDLQVVGFDDIPEASRAESPLTTVCQQNVNKGQLAAKLLLGGDSKDISVSTKLIIRKTTRNKVE
ncbi:LacI family DNA-binding transcriptional regulator [Paraneptunicella aestuarii]|uniref:LacI family DNA-binding transcriptional regulator n=1 Tax=Paraneptunicella aestuarii TaxID=2831148 RepID=UPI001E59015E|nr:LacI family DNA-binding transcriptional regulator [Paraneptunicella aestuarii]UAA39222.1 LacI family DNA-binding transcriptional regulator [Paraneptunicella aestuarii]